MAVERTPTIIQYFGNGSTTVGYPTGFPFKLASWVQVFVSEAGVSRQLSPNGDYTITGEANPAGGDIKTTAAFGPTVIVTILRSAPIIQLLDMVYNDRLPAQLLEDALDKLTLISQELADLKLLKFPSAELTDNPRVLPDAVKRKGCVFGFDPATGEAVLFKMPLPVLPTFAPFVGTYLLKSINGVIQWVSDEYAE